MEKLKMVVSARSCELMIGTRKTTSFTQYLVEGEGTRHTYYCKFYPVNRSAITRNCYQTLSD